MGIVGKNLKRIATKIASHCYRREKDLWVFGEWMGNRCCDNSLSFANYIAENHPQIRLVWIAKKTADTSLLSPKIRVVEMESPEAVGVLRRAGVAVMNQGRVDFAQDMSFDCDGALTVQLWHGVPWKKIGLDGLPANGTFHRLYNRYLQHLQRADLHLVLSDDFAQIMNRAYCAEKKGMIFAGYPRNRIFYQKEKISEARNKILDMLHQQGLQVSADSKIITYMPTFRDNTEDVFSFEQLQSDSRLSQLLDEHDAVIVQKAHFVSHQRSGGKDSAASCRITSLNDAAAQELLAATDILVTDYSSCFFDFLLLDRPIIHYIYDYDYYAHEDRGLYYKAEDVVCGDDPRTVDALLDSLKKNLEDPGKDSRLRSQRKGEYLQYESVNSCEILFAEIQKRLH